MNNDDDYCPYCDMAYGDERDEDGNPYCDCQGAELERLRDACFELLQYRENHTLSFQLEKLDDYLRKIRIILGEP